MNSNRQSRNRNNGERYTTEADPLLSSSQPGYSGTSTIRERRPHSSSNSNSSINSAFSTSSSALDKDNIMNSIPTERQQPSFAELPEGDQVSPAYGGDPDASYEMYTENDNYSNGNSRLNRSLRSIRSAKSHRDTRFSRTYSDGKNNDERGDKLHQYYNERANRIFSEPPQPASDEPLVEVSEEIQAVRRAALRVYEPLTYTWLIFSPGISITAALGMAKWSGFLKNVSYLLVLSPCWISHALLVASHIYAVKALSTFIADANRNRQSSDSTDHINRTEYLPLLQRSLKFGIKTGLVSLAIFIFEVLLYIRLAHSKMSLTAVLTPIWIIAIGGILDGIICKTQHALRVFSWTLLFGFMTLLVLKVDHSVSALTWGIVFVPLLVLMSIFAAALVYIMHGRHIGYFRLTDLQYAAGMLYSGASLSSIILIMMFLIQDLARPSTRNSMILMEILAPLSLALLSLGAYAVSRDEYERLLQYGGQAAVHPMKLSLEKSGWNVVESKGVTCMPMFGEVKCEPLDPRQRNKFVTLCTCCGCYPYEEEEENTYVGPSHHGHGSPRRLT